MSLNITVDDTKWWNSSPRPQFQQFVLMQTCCQMVSVCKPLELVPPASPGLLILGQHLLVIHLSQVNHVAAYYIILDIDYLFVSIVLIMHHLHLTIGIVWKILTQNPHRLRMYIRVKRANQTIFLTVEPSDSILATKTKLSAIHFKDPYDTRLIKSDRVSIACAVSTFSLLLPLTLSFDT